MRHGFEMPNWRFKFAASAASGSKIFPVPTHLRRIRVHLGAEVAKHNERLGFAGVFVGDTGLGTVFGAEVFVFGQFGEADEFGAVKRMAIDLAVALNADQTIGAVVFDAAVHARLDGEFFGGEELFAGDFAIDDPAVHVSGFARVRDGDRFEVMMVFEFRVNVGGPVELVHDPVEVPVFALGHVFDEERPGNFAAFDERLIHGEDVAAPLRFVSAERAGGVKDARANEPTRAGLEAIGLGQIKNAVVAFVPVFQAAPDLGFGGAGFEAEESVWKIVADVVVLRGEVVGLRFAFLADEFGLFGTLVHVMRDRAHVIEELRIDRPFLVLVPNPFADDGRATFGDGPLQSEPLPARDDVTKALVGCAIFVGGGRGGGEPTFVNAAAVEGEG